MKKNIAVLPGDGVGPEIVKVSVKLLEDITKIFNHDFTVTEGLIGAIAIDETGSAYPDETKNLCESSDAILFGAIGDPKYDNDPTAKVRPEQGLLAMRKSLGLYANIRPVAISKSSIQKSPLKKEIIDNTDFVVVRELTGGIYFGEPRGKSEDGTRAFDTCVYNKYEIERVIEYAIKIARTRKKKITVVDKANVLATSRLWREVAKEFEAKNKDVAFEYMFVDNCAMQIIKRPSDFDVIVTENMFGDILTDEASVITGSIGMLPSASIGGKIGLYEPIHGSFPKAKGTNTANPIGTILSAAMMLDYSFGLAKEAAFLRKAIDDVLEEGISTKDISSEKYVGTKEFGESVSKKLYVNAKK
ncbi:MAG: 3-isopropylmalate dehydrogenase [Patescibacteria group bacterium]